jgi:glucokinase
VGVGVPGRVDCGPREVLSGGYVDLSGPPFAERLAEATGLPVVLENDAAMALLGEQAHGAAAARERRPPRHRHRHRRERSSRGGRLLRGRRAAGQLGHLVVEPDGLPCLCGKRGCLETTSAGPALARLLREAGLPPSFAPTPAGRGRPVGAGILDAWARPLRRAVDTSWRRSTPTSFC